jgi:NAD+ kinase
MLESLGCEVRLDRPLTPSLKRPGHPLAAIGRWCDVLISLGGDGTALRGANALAGRKGALLAINLGGLGFLTVAEEEDLDRAVEGALRGQWPVIERRLVDAVVTRRGKRLYHGLAVNDAVLKAAGGYAAVRLRMSALDTELGDLVADGLIVASAAGSTAYSRSAGGPILSQAVEPLGHRGLSARHREPLVLAGGEACEAQVRGSFDPVALYLDGQECMRLQPHDQLRVTLARESVRLFQNPDQPLGRALRAKLGWLGTERRGRP